MAKGANSRSQSKSAKSNLSYNLETASATKGIKK
jgi:hypothetical protein